MKNISLKNLDVTINSGELVSIIGPNGSGKTLLLKMICGKIENNYFYIDDKIISDYDINYKKNNIVCVMDDNFYNTDKVSEELEFYLNKLCLSNEEIDSRLSKFIEYFDLDKIKHSYFINLDTEDRIYIKILSLLIIKPLLFCIDDLLTYLSIHRKMKILNYIKDNNITFLSITSNMEELLLFDKILVMNKGEKVLYDSALNVLKDEKVFKDLSISLPFIYDINNLLKSYELIDDYHIIYKELVDMLWK